MGLIRDILQRAKERKEKLRVAEEDDRVYSNLETKKKSHYERELIKRLEEERQEHIKQALFWDNKKEQALQKKKARDMMKFNPEFFNQDVVLKQKNLFLRGGDF